MAAIKAADWESLTTDFSAVMDLVMEKMKWGGAEVQRYRGEILRLMVAEFEARLQELINQAGCSRSANLTNTNILRAMGEDAARWAQSIVDTYNRDLAYFLQSLRTEVPTANRNTYVKRLREWATARDQWKSAQIAANAATAARQYSAEAFIQRNQVQAVAYVDGNNPAAEKECQALIDGAPYPADRLPARFPIHVGCLHSFRFEQMTTDVPCSEIWTGS